MTMTMISRNNNPVDGDKFRRYLADTSSTLSNRWYRTFGPSTKHLHLELYLWLVTMLIIISNMQGIYRESFGTRGDLVFVAISALWCGKHLLWRWISCWDPSTVHCPCGQGLISHIFNNYLMSGQVHERPSPRQIARLLNLKDDTAPLLRTSQSTFGYASRLWKINGGRRLNQLFRRLQEICGKEDATTITRGPANIPKPVLLAAAVPPRSKFGRALASCWKHAETLRRNSPSIQFLIYCAGLVAIKSMVRHQLRYWYLYKKDTAATSLYSASLGVAMKQEHNMMKRNRDYQPRDLDIFWWSDVWSPPVLIFVALTMWVFARVIPPLPDLVAGSHPLQEIRNDKTNNNNAANQNNNSNKNFSGRANGNSSNNNSKDNITNGFWAQMASWGFASPTIHAWSEAQAPIANVPRFALHTAILLLRMTDVLWVGLLLPRSDVVCRLTGHCSSPWDWSERAHYLYPVGITGPRRLGFPSQILQNQVEEPVSFLCIFWNIMTLVPPLLLAQSLLTNRTYWAAWGICAKEWENLGSWDGKSNHPTWDARRKYKKDDVVVYQRKMFKATLTHPEGRPLDGFQRYMQKLLAEEVGNFASSPILNRLARMQLFNFSVQFILWSYLRVVALDWNGFSTAVLANGLVAIILSKVGFAPTSTLAKVNAEVMGTKEANGKLV